MLRAAARAGLRRCCAGSGARAGLRDAKKGVSRVLRAGGVARGGGRGRRAISARGGGLMARGRVPAKRMWPESNESELKKQSRKRESQAAARMRLRSCSWRVSGGLVVGTRPGLQLDNRGQRTSQSSTSKAARGVGGARPPRVKRVKRARSDKMRRVGTPLEQQPGAALHLAQPHSMFARLRRPQRCAAARAPGAGAAAPRAGELS